MYVGVIRGDMPGPIFIADLEPLSQTNFPVEPFGQTAYVSRPSATQLTDYLGGLDPNYDNTPYQGSGGVPAGVQGSAAVTFPVTITTGVNDTLQFKNLSTASYSSAVVAGGTYPNMPTLLAALNTAMAPFGIGSATTDSATETYIVIQSSVPGVGSFIEIGAGDINATLHLSTSQTFTMPAATTIINGLLPVGGPLNVSAANVLTYLGASPAAQGAVAIIAPQFVETLVAIQSFQVGVLSKFLETTYNPDPTLLPPLPNGPAITVVENDGMTTYTAPLPFIASAAHSTPNPGDITITGTDLGNSEFFYATTVTVTAGTSQPGVKPAVITLPQQLITSTFTGGTQGSVSATEIVIPASLLTYSPPGNPFPPVPAGSSPALGVAGSLVEVQFTTLANGNYGSAGNVASAVAGAPYVSSNGSIQNRLIVTLTGLTNMTAAMVGFPIFIKNAASPGNNGSFIIQSYVSATSVTIYNNAATAPDANNGSIQWTVEGPIPFTVT